MTTMAKQTISTNDESAVVNDPQIGKSKSQMGRSFAVLRDSNKPGT